VTANPEAWLGVLVLALYLQDALLFLAPDEAVLVEGARGRWQAAFGARGWKLAGREVLLPALFHPHRPLFRLRWRMDGDTPEPPIAGRGVAPSSQALRRLAPFAWGAWMALFVVLPLGLYTRLGGPVVLAAIVLVCLNNLMALWMAYRWRDRLGLDGRSVLLNGLECLACAPYGINLVPRLCARMQVQEDFVHAAHRLLGPSERAEADRQCLARIDEQIDAHPEGGVLAQALQAGRRRFQPAVEQPA